MAVQKCSSCSRTHVSDAIYCPHCLSMRMEPSVGWFPISTEGSDNKLLQHTLVPEHRLLPEQRTQQLLKEYDVERTNLPKIKDSDPAIKHLACAPGDVIEIVRNSRTTDTAKSYRLVVSKDLSAGGSTASREEWRNPASPAEDLYVAPDELSKEKALHILSNLRAHVPPSQPGACEIIAVDREEEIETAVARITDSVPCTFVQGELGFGKSFFLQWVRDKTFPTSAVSFVDLDDEVTFTNTEAIVDAFWRNLETPRSTVNDQYANGADEMWDTFLRQTADLCAGYYEGQGYELQKSRVAESLSRAVEDILNRQGLKAAVAEALAEAARGYFDSSTKSLTQILRDDVAISEPMGRVSLVTSLSRLNGYHVLLGVDELEKSDRKKDHFRAIQEFVDALPEGASLIITGTPELATGGQKGNAMRETYRPLYDQTKNNRIALEEPTRDDLVTFSKQVQMVEDTAIENPDEREYSRAIASSGGVEEAVDSFLTNQSPSFRAYLTYLEGE